MADLRASLPKPPKHLSTESTRWWRQVVREYDLEPHHLRLLQAATEAWDRLQQACQEIADNGSLVVNAATGGIKPHPALAVERDARIGFARMMRELDLDAGTPSEARRPPALASNRR